MTFAQANKMRANPHYNEGDEYKRNCQSTVVAFEMRRRGFNVEAFGNNGSTDFTPKLLSRKTQAAWLDEKGNIPQPIIIQASKNMRAVIREKLMAQPGRYHVSWVWKESKKGHIVTVESSEKGLVWYDPQSGEKRTGFPWTITSIDQEIGFKVLRVDNLRPNVDVQRGVLRPAGTNGKVPELDARQKELWSKVTGRKIEGANDNNPRRENRRERDIRLRTEAKSQMRLHEETNITNIQTGTLRRTSNAREDFLYHKHCRTNDIDAAHYIWEHPEDLKFVRESPLGEVKDLTNEHDRTNVQRKKDRGVECYNIYKFDYRGKTYAVKLEKTSNGKERFYSFTKLEE